MRAKTCIDGSNPSVSARHKRSLVERLCLARDATVDEKSRFDEHAPRANDIGGGAEGGPGEQRRDEDSRRQREPKQSVRLRQYKRPQTWGRLHFLIPHRG